MRATLAFVNCDSPVHMWRLSVIFHLASSFQTTWSLQTEFPDQARTEIYFYPHIVTKSIFVSSSISDMDENSFS